MIETVAELRAVLDKLPDDAPILIENRCDRARFHLFRADAWGLKTDKPFLRLMTANEDCDCTRDVPEHPFDDAIAVKIQPRRRFRVTAIIVPVLTAGLGSFALSTWIHSGEGFWSFGVPGALLFVAGIYGILRNWLRR
jgi:hypothetical protein